MRTLGTLDAPPAELSLVRRLFSVCLRTRPDASRVAVPLSGLQPRPGEVRRSPSTRPCALAIVMALAVAILAAAPPSSAAGLAAAAPMHIGRRDHTASLLPNGNVLVAGGYGFYGYGPLSSAEIYDPVANSWRHAASMYGPRYRHRATTLQDGSILITGGTIGASAERFDPVAETWTRLPLMGQERTDHTATLLASGKVLVAGGVNPTVLGSAEIFDPVSQTWSVASPMGSLRYLHTATLLADGRVLVVGGLGGPGDSTASAEIYDPATNTWSPTGSLNCPRFRHTALRLPSGKVMVIDGMGNGVAISCNEAYDPAKGTWTLLAANAVARTSAATSLLASGKVLLTGGSGSNPLTKVAELYDPSSDHWTTAGNLLVARYSHTSTALASGGALVAGGTNGNVLESTERYTPPTPTVVEIDMPSTSVVGQSYVVLADVSAAQGTPTGSVLISDDSGASCGPVPLNLGSASCALVSTVAGARTVTAAYLPANSEFEESSVSLQHPVERADTSLDLDIEPDSTMPGEEVTATISLAVIAPGSGSPGGFVQVTELGGGGSCSIVLPDLQCVLLLTGGVGMHSIEAAYSGDDNFLESNASADHLVYDPFSEIQIISVTPEPSVVGQPVTVAYAVSAPDGDPTGSVTVTATTGETCTAPVTAGSCGLAFFVDGPRTLVARYSGDTLHDPSDSPAVAHNVLDATTTLSIIGHSPDPSLPFQAVQVEASLSVDRPGAGTPHGGIYVSDGIDNCTIPEGGSTCQITLHTRGPRTLSAEYSGDGDYAASSDQLIHHVNRLPLVGNVEYSTTEHGALTVAAGQGVLAAVSDPDGDALTVANAGTIIATGLGGSVELATNGSFTYTPPTNATGNDAFGFTVSDGLEQVGALATIHVLEAIDLSINVDDGIGFAPGGSEVEYLIDVHNAGPADAVGAIVRNTVPANLEGATWACLAQAGASCTPSGSGDIDDPVGLPSGSSLTYALRGTVGLDPELPLIDTASVLAPSGRFDTNPGNDSASDVDIVGIFAGSFE